MGKTNIMDKLEKELNKANSGELTNATAYDKISNIFKDILGANFDDFDEKRGKNSYVSEYLEVLLLFSSIEYNQDKEMEYNFNGIISRVLDGHINSNENDSKVDYFGKFFSNHAKVLDYCNKNSGALYVGTTEDMYKNINKLYNDLTMDKISSEGVIMEINGDKIRLDSHYRGINMEKNFKTIDRINVIDIDDYAKSLGVRNKNGKLIFEDYISDSITDNELDSFSEEEYILFEDSDIEEDEEDINIDGIYLDYDDYGDLAVTSVPTYLLNKDIYKLSGTKKSKELIDNYGIGREDILQGYYVLELENSILGIDEQLEDISVDEISDRVMTSYSYTKKDRELWTNKAVLCGEHIIGIAWERVYNKNSMREDIFKSTAHFYVYKLNKEIIDDLDIMSSRDRRDSLQFDLLDISLDIKDFVKDTTNDKGDETV